MARQLRIQPDQFTSRDQKPSQSAGQSLLQERRLSGSSQCSPLRSDDYFRQVLESLPANRSLGREFVRKEFLKTFLKIAEAFVFYGVLQVGCRPWSTSISVQFLKEFLKPGSNANVCQQTSVRKNFQKPFFKMPERPFVFVWCATNSSKWILTNIDLHSNELHDPGPFLNVHIAQLT